MTASRLRRHLLLSLRLPGNVERTLSDLQMQIFKATGACSSQALPAFIPLAYLDDRCDADIVSLLPQEEMAAVEVGELTPCQDTVVFTASLSDAWERWLSNLRRAPSPSGMPMPGCGVFLAATDAVTWTAAGQVSAAAMPHHLTVMKIELIDLTVADDDEWWQNVEWEALWSKRIKLRG